MNLKELLESKGVALDHVDIKELDVLSYNQFSVDSKDLIFLLDAAEFQRLRSHNDRDHSVEATVFFYFFANNLCANGFNSDADILVGSMPKIQSWIADYNIKPEFDYSMKLSEFYDGLIKRKERFTIVSIFEESINYFTSALSGIDSTYDQKISHHWRNFLNGCRYINYKYKKKQTLN